MPQQENDLAELGRRSLYFFARGILGYDYMTKELHEPFCNFLQDMSMHNKLGVLPRSFLKSTIGCKALPLWLTVKDPNVRILITCNIIDNAMNHIRSIKAIVETNTLFRQLYPEIIPNIRKVRWSDHALEFKRTIGYGEATIEANGLGTDVVSRHYNWKIGDDILTGKKDSVTRDELQPSQLDIERAIGWWKLSVSLLDTPENDYSLYLGTRWSIHDVIDYILTEDKTCIPYIQNVYRKGTEEPIYPERFGAKALEMIKGLQGSYIYASQYLLTPLPAERMVFKPNHIQYFTHLPANVPYWIYTYVDPAISSKKESCNTAIITIARTFDNRIYVLECIREKGMSVSQLANAIFGVHRKYKPRLVGIESIAYQEAIGKHLREKMKLDDYFFSIRDDVPTRDESKDARIRGMQPRFEAMNVWIKEHMSGLETELLEYQGVDNSRYVDAIDALAGAIKISSCPPPPVNTVHIDGITMEMILNELRGKTGYKLPFKTQLQAMNAPKNR